MSMTGLQPFDTTVQKSNEWLADMAGELHVGRHDAYRALRSCLHALRDRLPVEVSAHLAAQLPMLLRGLYYEGWQPAKVPASIRSGPEFIARVQAELTPPLVGRAQEALAATFRVLERHLSPGEAEKLRSILPEPLRMLWLDTWVS